MRITRAGRAPTRTRPGVTAPPPRRDRTCHRPKSVNARQLRCHHSVATAASPGSWTKEPTTTWPVRILSISGMSAILPARSDRQTPAALLYLLTTEEPPGRAPRRG